MINLLNKAYRKALQLLYGFDKWHVATLKERPYAVDIISFCNRLPRRGSFAEIGCGLGDIIRNVRFSTRKGFDMDEKVLRAARLLPVTGNKPVSYEVFTFPESPLAGTFQVITMVNWIHHISPETLRNKIAAYMKANIEPGGCIIVDTVQDPAYRFNHDIDLLTAGLHSSVQKIGNYARGREVWAILKKE